MEPQTNEPIAKGMTEFLGFPRYLKGYLTLEGCLTKLFFMSVISLGVAFCYGARVQKENEQIVDSIVEHVTVRDHQVGASYMDRKDLVERLALVDTTTYQDQPSYNHYSLMLEGGSGKEMSSKDLKQKLLGDGLLSNTGVNGTILRRVLESYEKEEK